MTKCQNKLQVEKLVHKIFLKHDQVVDIPSSIDNRQSVISCMTITSCGAQKKVEKVEKNYRDNFRSINM